MWAALECRKTNGKPSNRNRKYSDTRDQSQVSAKNIGRLTTLAASENLRIAALARIVLVVAKVKPHKKGRIKVLALERSDLLEGSAVRMTASERR